MSLSPLIGVFAFIFFSAELINIRFTSAKFDLCDSGDIDSKMVDVLALPATPTHVMWTRPKRGSGFQIPGELSFIHLVI